MTKRNWRAIGKDVHECEVKRWFRNVRRVAQFFRTLSLQPATPTQHFAMSLNFEVHTLPSDRLCCGSQAALREITPCVNVASFSTNSSAFLPAHSSAASSRRCLVRRRICERLGQSSLTVCVKIRPERATTRPGAIVDCAPCALQRRGRSGDHIERAPSLLISAGVFTARRLRIEISQRLQLQILFFRQKLTPMAAAYPWRCFSAYVPSAIPPFPVVNKR